MGLFSGAKMLVFQGGLPTFGKHPPSPGPSGPHMVDGLAPPVTPGSSRAASVPWWVRCVVCWWLGWGYRIPWKI